MILLQHDIFNSLGRIDSGKKQIGQSPLWLHSGCLNKIYRAIQRPFSYTLVCVSAIVPAGIYGCSIERVCKRCTARLQSVAIFCYAARRTTHHHAVLCL
jgi:hypothetical protein